MELDCGISSARLSAWLDDELRLESVDGGWHYVFDGASCRIALSPLASRPLGKVSIERTLLSVEGNDAAVVEFERLFTLRFASAGG